MTGQVDDLLAARQLASLEELALAYLREDPAEVTTMTALTVPAARE